MTTSTRWISAVGSTPMSVEPSRDDDTTRRPSSSTSVRFGPSPRKFRKLCPALVANEKAFVGVEFSRNCGIRDIASINPPDDSSSSERRDITVTGVGEYMPLGCWMREPVTTTSGSIGRGAYSSRTELSLKGAVPLSWVAGA